ncbi:6889_t:CDS:1, partial [Ambispora gerdemannii]
MAPHKIAYFSTLIYVAVLAIMLINAELASAFRFEKRVQRGGEAMCSKYCPNIPAYISGPCCCLPSCAASSIANPNPDI